MGFCWHNKLAFFSTDLWKVLQIPQMITKKNSALLWTSHYISSNWHSLDLNYVCTVRYSVYTLNTMKDRCYWVLLSYSWFCNIYLRTVGKLMTQQCIRDLTEIQKKSRFSKPQASGFSTGCNPCKRNLGKDETRSLSRRFPTILCDWSRAGTKWLFPPAPWTGITYANYFLVILIC